MPLIDFSRAQPFRAFVTAFILFIAKVLFYLCEFCSIFVHCIHVWCLGRLEEVVRSPRTGVKVGVLETKPGPPAGAEILLMPSLLQRTRFALRTYYRLLHFRLHGFFICCRAKEPSLASFIRQDWDLECSSSGFLMTAMSDLVECFPDPTGDKLANKFLRLKEANQRHSQSLNFFFSFLLKSLMGLGNIAWIPCLYLNAGHFLDH